MLAELLNDKEVRKLQLVGGSTYVLSLPKKWIDELNLKTGDPVSIVKNVIDLYQFYLLQILNL